MIEQIGKLPVAIPLLGGHPALDAKAEGNLEAEVLVLAIGPVVAPARLGIGVDVHAILAVAQRNLVALVIEQRSGVEGDGRDVPFQFFQLHIILVGQPVGVVLHIIVVGVNGNVIAVSAMLHLIGDVGKGEGILSIAVRLQGQLRQLDAAVYVHGGQNDGVAVVPIPGITAPHAGHEGIHALVPALQEREVVIIPGIPVLPFVVPEELHLIALEALRDAEFDSECGVLVNLRLAVRGDGIIRILRIVHRQRQVRLAIVHHHKANLGFAAVIARGVHPRDDAIGLAHLKLIGGNAYIYDARFGFGFGIPIPVRFFVLFGFPDGFVFLHIDALRADPAVIGRLQRLVIRILSGKLHREGIILLAIRDKHRVGLDLRVDQLPEAHNTYRQMGVGTHPFLLHAVPEAHGIGVILGGAPTVLHAAVAALILADRTVLVIQEQADAIVPAGNGCFDLKV